MNHTNRLGIVDLHANQPDFKSALKPADDSNALDQERQAYRLKIAEAAYYKAEARGFIPGHELDDWLAAEIEFRVRVHGRDLQQ